ncbi:MAG TPA: phosphotransferase family protein [Micromonosporaceae bacterium]|nr:phosphotransferase family protein [Micromonosporaceae bacterium]
MTDPAVRDSVELPGLDLVRLRSYLDSRPSDSPTGQRSRGPLRAERVEGGKSNLTYVVTDGTSEFVVRRPPLGHVLATAHDMSREFRVMTALGPTSVPVPATYLLCEDSDVIGAPFYVMQFVAGMVYRGSAQTSALTVPRATAIAHNIIDVLADLHDVDPVAVGLGDFGRPDGYLQRQVVRWGKQLAASRSRDLPGIGELQERLAADIPLSGAPAIVHGDYRLDNAIVDDHDRVAAVLDWEMATLGDPLADLGLLLVYWDGVGTMPRGTLNQAVTPDSGFPTGSELIARYAARRDVDLGRLPWYHAFGFFKLAVIAEGIHYRYSQGQTVGGGFAHMGDVVVPLAEKGLAVLHGDPIDDDSDHLTAGRHTDQHAH